MGFQSKVIWWAVIAGLAAVLSAGTGTAKNSVAAERSINARHSIGTVHSTGAESSRDSQPPGTAQAIDAVNSRLMLRVDKSGFFSGLAHAHQISAPISSGSVEVADPARVQFVINAGKLKVLDPDQSQSDRDKVQETMLGASVLDADNYPEIKFISETVERIGDAHWRVHGRLTLHGQTQPIELETTLEKGHYRGTASVLQTHFGITPIRLAGGTIQVKDEVKIEFDIVLAGQ